MADIALQGTVESVVYRNDQTDWSVLNVRFSDENGERVIKMTGHTSAHAGQGINATGDWKRFKDELQFVAKTIIAYLPTTKEGIVAFLSSGMVSGIGERTARLIVETFGLETIKVLDEFPEKVQTIKGIGPTKAAKIAAGWSEQRKISKIMLFLHSQSISPGLCKRIYKTYGDDAIEVIRDNPYRLCFEVKGIGFKTADEIGSNLAIPKASEHRVMAGLAYLMNEASTQGHCGLHLDDLVQRSREELGVGHEVVVACIKKNLAEEKPAFYQEDMQIFLVKLARMEERIAERLRKMAEQRPVWDKPSMNTILKAQSAVGTQLASKQSQAVDMALSRKVCVISGGPGVGKTTTLNVLLKVMMGMKLNIALAAPTGKAAQRASEATGLPSATLHRLLGLKGDGAPAPGQLEADVLVVDEFSMVDVPLMASMLRCLAPRTALIMVGDIDQLPSVGPGNVLGDVIRSGVVPVTILDEVFRQAAGSLIIRNAHAINKGQAPVSGAPSDDFFIITEKGAANIREAVAHPVDEERPALVAKAVAEKIESIVSRRLPGRYGFNPIRDIQVLCPMNGGDCGVYEMNLRLQRALNPSPAEHITRFGTRFGLGDKVIQTRNNYDLNIFNGDMGFVRSIDKEAETVIVEFDTRHIAVPLDDLDDLRLAYAMTIHKSQGSQAPAVVIPLTTQSWMMLQRNLIYTGVTRARKLVVLVGQERAIAKAVRTADSKNRITRLAKLLRGEISQQPQAAPEPQQASFFESTH